MYLSRQIRFDECYLCPKFFGDKTIFEVLQYLSIHLKVSLDITKVFASQWHTYTYHVKQLEDSLTSSTHVNLCSNISLLKFQIFINGTFIEKLLHPKWRLEKDNLLDEKIIFQDILQYFQDWKREIGIEKSKKIASTRAADFYFISSTTYGNLITLVK